MSFTIDYADDYGKARELILDICNAHELIEKEPAPFVRMSEHSPSAIVISVKVWTKNATYWEVYFDLNEKVKASFDANEIHIPFNQLDVHIKKED